MRVLIFHGYLLHGTGSNVYNANLAAALVRLGHEVHLLCQDREPETLPFVDAVGDWDGGELAVRTVRHPVRCTVYRPALAGLLPVYVADRYPGIEARPLPACSDSEIDAYVAANVRAVREVLARAEPDLALANHLVMGPLILARALDGAVPYAVKIHGSALEYVVAQHPERFGPAAREGLARARAVLVGSGHIARRLEETLAGTAPAGTAPASTLPIRTTPTSAASGPPVLLGPPGVDVARFAPCEVTAARAGLRALAARLARAAAPGGSTGAAAPAPVDPARATPDAASGAAQAREAPDERSAFAREASEGATALAELVRGVDRPAGEEDRLVAFVGKLIVSKGIDLLLAAWPLVLQREPRARLVVVGFGAFREALTRLLEALAVGDDGTVEAIVAAGRRAEDPAVGAAPLRYLRAFLDSLSGEERERYRSAARALPERVVMTGRLEHDELVELLPACEALVVPSTFPEAFGMVAAEAAACGALPVCAGHSGLAEVAEALAESAPEPARPLLSFPLATSGPGPVRELADRVSAWLEAPGPVREQTRAALVTTVRERWSWEGVARSVIAAVSEGAERDADAARDGTPEAGQDGTPGSTRR